jgi:putative endonuclease
VHLPRPAFVYLISNKSRTLYCGITTDLRKRFEEHKSGAYPNGFTTRYRFTRLVWFEATTSLAAAAKREKEIKGWSRAKKLALIQATNPDWIDLSPRLDPLYWLA